MANKKTEKKTVSWKIGIGITELLDILPPMIGGVITILGMSNAFAEMGNSGIGDPAALSGHISNVLQATLWGMIVSCAGVVCLVISIVKFLRFRSLLKSLTNP